MIQANDMSFDFSLILTSIVLGLGVTSLLSNFASWIENVSRVNFYWPQLFWALAICVALGQFWLASWQMQGEFKWTPLPYAIYILYPALLYIISELMFPKLDSPRIVSLKDHYEANRQWIFGLAAILPLDVFIYECLVYPEQGVINEKNICRLGWLVIFVVLSRAKSYYIHVTSSVIVLLSLIVFLIAFQVS
ncbi:MAG TPA: hypothetical protein VF789_25595 [Thermoanaerobaculia bacterium]